MNNNFDYLENDEEYFNEGFNENINEEGSLSAYDIYVKEIGKYEILDKEEENKNFLLLEKLNKEVNNILFLTKEVDFLLKHLDSFRENKKSPIVTFYNDEKNNLTTEKKGLNYIEDEKILLNKTKIFKEKLKSFSKLYFEKNNQYYEEYQNLLNSVKFEYSFLEETLNELKTKELIDKENYLNIRKKLFSIKKFKDAIVNSNLKLVIKISKNYSTNQMQKMDLIQEGNIGLIKGIDKFDYKMGYKLSTYVSWWIKQSINDALNKKSRSIKLPSNIINTIYKIKKYDDDNLSIEELSKKLNMSISKIKQALEAPNDVISMDGIVNPNDINGDKEMSIGDLFSSNQAEPYYELSLEERNKMIRKIIKTYLSDREETILINRFGLNEKNEEETLEEVGKRVNLTRERVRQIESEIINNQNFKEVLQNIL